MSLKIAGRLFTQRRFWPLFTLLQTGTLNDNGLKQALIGLITFGGVAFLSDLDSTIRVPVAALIFTGPFLLVCAIAGQIADKVDRGLILKRIKTAEIFIMLLAALGFWLVDVRILSVALALMGAQSAFFSPTKNAVLPQWLTDDELISGNAILNGFVFVFVMVGYIVGLSVVLHGASGENGLVQMGDAGPRILSILLFIMAIIGWLASRFCPPAPAPLPELKINFEPLTATWSVLKNAFLVPQVLRPMLGVAWFYGSSTVFVTAFPDLVATTLGYEAKVLIVIQLLSITGILIGSLLCMFLSRLPKLGANEAVKLSAIGITMLTIFALDLYLFFPESPFGAENRGSFEDFMAQEGSIRLLIDVFMTAFGGGLFVVPLQAMQQRRSEPKVRARLMSAGAVLLNLAVNIITFMLIAMAVMRFDPLLPFLIVVIVSGGVAAYAIYRSLKPVSYPTYTKDVI